MTWCPWPPLHGTLWMYRAGFCRCRACRAANADAHARYLRAKLRGHITLKVSPEKARAYLQELRDQGIGLDRLAELSGVSRRTLQQLCRHRSRAIWPATERAILSIRPIPALGATVDATETRRRLRALFREGFTPDHLSRALHLHRRLFSRYLPPVPAENGTALLQDDGTVRVRTAVLVRSLFRRHADGDV